MAHNQLLEKLYQAQPLTQNESYHLFTSVVQGKLSSEQLAGGLMALKVRGENIDEVAGAVKAIQENAQAFPIPDYPFADIVGTGGDGANTINISTATSLVCGSLSEKTGSKIAKHGNQGVTSKSGSSDVLTALGVNVNCSPSTARQALDEIGICFLFAQQYHKGYKHAMPVRRALKTATIFNNLGPLINPARPKRQLLGVSTPQLIDMYAQTAVALGHEHSLVVHGVGADGAVVDEVALHGVTQVAEIKNGKISHYQLTPTDFGFTEQPLSVLEGGTPQENAQAIINLLKGEGNIYHAQAVAINVAMALKLFGYDDLKQSANMVMEHLASGQAIETLESLKKY